jgi:virulence-associated protein VapD
MRSSLVIIFLLGMILLVAGNAESKPRPFEETQFVVDVRAGSSTGFSYSHVSDAKMGLFAGAGVLFPIRPFFSIEPLAYYNQQRVALLNAERNSYSTYQAQSLTVPFLFRFHSNWDNLIVPYAAIGPQLVIAFQSDLHVPENESMVSGSYSILDEVNPVNIGLTLDVGAEFNSKIGRFSLNFSYFLNFLRTIHETIFAKPVRISQFFLSVGYQFDVIPEPEIYEPEPIELQPIQPAVDRTNPVLTVSTREFIIGGPDSEALDIHVKNLDKNHVVRTEISISNKEGQEVRLFRGFGGDDHFVWDAFDRSGRYININETQTFTITGFVKYDDEAEPRPFEPIDISVSPYIYDLPEEKPILNVQSELFTPDGDGFDDSAVIVVENLFKPAVNSIEIYVYDQYDRKIRTMVHHNSDEIFLWSGETDDGSIIYSHSTYRVSGVVSYRGHEETHELDPITIRTGAAFIEFDTRTRYGFYIRSEGFTFGQEYTLTDETRELLEKAYATIKQYQFAMIQITVYFADEDVFNAYQKAEAIESFFYRKEIPNIQIISGVYPKDRKPEFSNIRSTLIEISIYNMIQGNTTQP